MYSRPSPPIFLRGGAAVHRLVLVGRVEMRLINIVPFLDIYFEVPKVPTLTLSKLAELRASLPSKVFFIFGGEELLTFETM